MSRLFKQHNVRTVVNLEGEWEHHFPATDCRLNPDDLTDTVKETMDVPCVWEMLDTRKSYRGEAVACRTVTVDADAHVRLVFKGVSHTARVFFDGREIGGHHNAFTPFTVDAGHVRAGEHEIRVHISNAHGELSALHVPNDYYNYGGISRPVEMQVLPKGVLIRHVHAVTSIKDEGWVLSCTAEILNLGDAARELTLRSTVSGLEYGCTVTASPGVSTVDWVLFCPEVQAWNPEDPKLYSLKTELLEDGTCIDDHIERIGFRTVGVVGQDIILNGKKIFPMGFNRHEDHADYGCAIPVDVMRADLKQMLAMNANAVRTSHYPNDERFLDLCDEMGILVWEENHARGLGMTAMKHPRFREQCASCNEEMVREHFNHPSIFVWGLLNECESGTEEGAAMYQEQVDQLRSLDSSRPITFASCRHNEDFCQGMVDIASWNIYPLWYHDRTVEETLDELITKREPEGMLGKPLIISEFGAGAIPGYHDPVRRAKWCEERQCDILDEQLRVILNHPRVGGAFIWQFCDVRVDESMSRGRPRTMNNKGAVDEHRRPKMVFDVIRRHFAEIGK